jgi:hypothetical protein
MMTIVSSQQEQGRVFNVYIEPAGDQAAATSSTGSSTLVLYDVSDFSENGGQLQVNGLVYSYLTIDDANATITLATTLSADVLLDTAVYHYPLAEEKWAMVQLNEDEDVILARIPHTLHDRFTDGIRTEADQESVLITPEAGVWTVLDVIAKVPEIEENYLGSDGFAPTVSPTPIAYGTPLSILLRWVPLANADPVTYDVYMSVTTGFTPDGSTLVVQDEIGSSATIRKTPTGGDLVYGTIYYFKIVAKDEDGAAPASPQTSGEMVQITNADISAAFAYLGTLFVDQLLGGTLNADILLASMISNRAGGAGAGVEINTNGIDIYDSAGVPATLLHPDLSKFKGEGEFNTLTATGPATFRKGIEVAQGSDIVLQAATTAPVAAPSIVIGWPDPVVADEISGGYGLVWTGTEWATVRDTGGTEEVLFDTSGLLQLGNDLTEPHAWGGLTRIGTDWYTLGWKAVEGAGYQWFITRYNSSGVQQTQVTYTPVGTAFGSGGDFAAALGVAAIGTDGTNILIAEFDDPNNKFRIQTRHPTTLSLTTTLNTSVQSGFTGPVVGIKSSSFDFGVSRFVVLAKNAAVFWTFDSSGTYQVNDTWPTPVPGSMSGFDWDGTRFWSTRAKHIAGNAWVYKHTTHKWSGLSTKTYYATSHWRDTDATGGTHATDMGPVATFSMKKRAGITLTSPIIPDSGGTDDPNAVSFSLGIVDTARTNLWIQALPADGINTLVVGDGIVFTGTNPPATNNFPGATAARMKNAAGDLEITAAGAIKGTSISKGAIPVVTTTEAQTLSNKTFAAGGGNSFPWQGNTETVTTDSGGFAVVSHSLGATPDFVVALCHGTNNYFCAINARSSTTFTVIINHKTGTVLVSGSITISWFAGL